MTSAVFFAKGSRCCGFKISGHSGYGEEGNDIVCAAVSAMTSLTATLLERFGVEFTFDTDELKAESSVGIKQATDISQNILSAFYDEMKSLHDEFPEYIRVVKKSVKGE